MNNFQNSDKPCRLRLDTEYADGTVSTAFYRSFYLAGETDNYRIHLAGHDYNTADLMAGVDGAGFSTSDHYTDSTGRTCALDYQTGWWYKNCISHRHHNTDFRGQYGQDSNANVRTEMKILADW